MGSLASEYPRISLVTPCLNAAATIDRTLDSIAANRYPNLQYVVCDGGSTDGTLDRVHARGTLVSHIICGPDKNVADAVNKGFRVADGEILCYLNADDALTPDALDHVAAFFRRHPDIDGLTGACERIYADGSEELTEVPEHYLQLLPFRNCLEQPSTFWRAAVHREAGELDDSFALAFDWEWWNRLCRAGARFAKTDNVLSRYYFSGENLTSKAGERVVDEMYRVTRRYARHGWAVARMYRFLYRTFDLRGYYDKPFSELTAARQARLGAALFVLYGLFGRRVVNAYNWNWASKQVRGLVWYR
jgi:glycosyltransferase involved in cell wall biosynthesis